MPTALIPNTISLTVFLYSIILKTVAKSKSTPHYDFLKIILITMSISIFNFITTIRYFVLSRILLIALNTNPTEIKIKIFINKLIIEPISMP